MTAIAGLVAPSGDVVIGGDSAGTDGWVVGLRADAKVFRRGPFLFGICGSFRLIDVIRYELQVEPQPDDMRDPREYLVRLFIPALQDAVREHATGNERHGAAEIPGAFLLGYRSRLFSVGGDYQVGEPMEGYDACGCGYQFSLGALASTPSRSPRSRVRLALEAAEKHSEGVRGPFVIETQKAGR